MRTAKRLSSGTQKTQTTLQGAKRSTKTLLKRTQSAAAFRKLAPIKKVVSPVKPIEKKTPIVKQNDPIGTATVTAGALNVRSGPGIEHPRIGGVTKGRVLEVFEEQNGWLRILYNSQSGWVSKKYTDYKGKEPEVVDPPVTPEPEPEPEPKPENKLVQTTAGLNMRDIPGNGTTPANGSTVYFTIPAGTVLTVEAEQNGWYKVTYNGKTGWVCANWTTSYTPPVIPDGQVPEGGDGVVVDVPIDPQNTSYNCGAASGAMSLAARGLKTTEQEVAVKAETNANDGTYVYKLSNALNHFAGQGNYKYTDMTKYSYPDYFNAMKSSIAAGSLPIVRLKPTVMADFGYKSGGHYVCISGAYTTSSGERRFVINDPYSSKWTSANPVGQKIDVKSDDILECSKAKGAAWMIHK